MGHSITGYPSSFFALFAHVQQDATVLSEGTHPKFIFGKGRAEITAFFSELGHRRFSPSRPFPHKGQRIPESRPALSCDMDFRGA